MATLDDYLKLITTEHRDKQKFVALVSLAVSPMVRVQELLDAMIPLFDLDTPPVGQQLDVIGEWVGVNRNVVIPIAGVLFSWDDTVQNGWDLGIWSGPNNPSSITVLPDDVFLTLIRAKIAANHWDGTTEGAYAIYNFIFPTVVILVQDEQDMSFNIGIVGTLDSLTFQLLIQGYLPLRPEGVRINSYYTQADANPFFAWDVSSTYLDGWDIGSWPKVTAGM